MKGFKKPLYFDTHAPGESAEPWSRRFMEAFNYCFVWQLSLFRADMFLTSCDCMHFPYWWCSHTAKWPMFWLIVRWSMFK